MQHVLSCPLHLNPGVEGGSRRLKAEGLRATPQCDVEGITRMAAQLQRGWHGSPGTGAAWIRESDWSETELIEGWMGAPTMISPSPDPRTCDRDILHM